jgi:hypothetical protein
MTDDEVTVLVAAAALGRMNQDELTLYDAAAALGIRPETLRDRLRRGKMRGRLVPGPSHQRIWAITSAEVERWKDPRRVHVWLFPREPEA